MTTVLTERKRPSDVLKEYWSENYNFEAATIKNVSGAAIAGGALQPGMVLKWNSDHWETVATGGVSGATIGIFVDERASEPLANNATSAKKYRILARGPAVIDLDALGLDLDAAAAFVPATVLIALMALSPPITQLREPPVMSSLTT